MHVCFTQALPPFLQAVVDRLVAAGVYSAAEAPNHCLVNEYRDGAGIPPHDDGPLYLNKVTVAASLLIPPHPSPVVSKGHLSPSQYRAATHSTP